MTINVNAVTDGFPHPSIQPIIGSPTYATIAAVHLQLNANAASVFSNLGDGQLGLLALTITEEVYNTLSAEPFVPPENPGTQPDLPGNASNNQIAEFVAEHKENQRIWREFMATDKALKQQLLATVNEMYYKALRNRITGYASITTLQLLTHLYAVYGNITPSDLADNDAQLKSPYDPAQPIETLFDQVEDAVDLAAAAQAPYTIAQIVAYAYNNVFQTGLFADACRDWRRRPAIEKTWVQFKVDFALAHQELRESLLTTQGAGYHAANALIFDNQQATIDAFANLATATTADRHTVNHLSSAQNHLSTALAEATTKLIAAQADIQALKEQMEQRNGPYHRKMPNNNNGNNKGNNKSYSSAVTGRKYHNNNYCWSHGYHIHDLHTSDTCRWTKEGHKKEATRENTMNGTTQGKELVK
jgi:hypothetical protein